MASTGVEPCGYVDAEFAQDHGDGLVPVLQGVQIEPCVVGREGPDAFGREFFQNSGLMISLRSAFFFSLQRPPPSGGGPENPCRRRMPASVLTGRARYRDY